MSGRLKVVFAYAVFAAIWVALFEHWMGQTMMRDASFQGWLNAGKGVVFVAVGSVLLYVALSIRHGQTLRTDLLPATQLSRLIGLFLSLSLIAPLLGYGIYRANLSVVREKAFADVDAVAALKAEQIESWLQQRNDNASVLAKDPYLIEAATQWLKNRQDVTQRDRISSRLKAIQQVYGYDAILLDASGHAVVSVAKHADLTPDIRQRLLPKALQTGQVQRSELYRDEQGNIHLDYIVPLKHDGTPAAAGVLLHMPIAQFLFPLIQRWPTPSPSAETMLVRRDGDQVLYLNELRHQHQTALSLRIPLNTPNSPSAMALRAGKASHMETSDRQGNAVLAASRPIAGTSWFVVAKIDRDEVLAGLRSLTLWVSLVALGAVAAIASSVWLLWRAQQRAHQMALLAQSAQRDELLRVFFDMPFLGMCITSPVNKRWLQVNARLCEILGYSREELMQLTWADVTHPDDLNAEVAQFERVLKGEIDGYQMDKRYVHKDGRIVETTIDVKAVRNARGEVEWFLATIQDITERKRMEASLRESEAKFRAIIDAEPECVKIIGADGTLQFMNPAGLEMLGAESLLQLQGRPLEDIIAPEYQHAFRRFTHQVINGGRASLEFEIMDLKGRKRFMDTHGVRLKLEPDGPVYLLGITRDITERKRMEIQLHQQMNELLRWQKVMLGREDRVQELKREVNALLVSRNEAIRYPSQETA